MSSFVCGFKGESASEENINSEDESNLQFKSRTFVETKALKLVYSRRNRLVVRLWGHSERALPPPQIRNSIGVLVLLNVIQFGTIVNWGHNDNAASVWLTHRS